MHLTIFLYRSATSTTRNIVLTTVWCWGWDGAGDLDGPDVDPIWEEQAPQSSKPEAVEIKHPRSLHGY